MSTQNRFKTIKKGTTFKGRDIKIYNGSGDTKTPMDLTGVLIEMKFRSIVSPNNGTVVFQFTTSDDSMTITGLGIVRMMPRLKFNFPVADYVADLILTFPNGTVEPYGELYWKVN